MADFFVGALSFSSLSANLLGVMFGILFGILPGLTATMAVSLLIPLTFGMSVEVAFSALLGTYVGSIYAGSITAILIGTPGTAAAAATLLEGPQLSKKGMAGEALSLTTIASFIGGIFSCAMLYFFAPKLARVALSFGPAEYFSLAFFGLTIVASLSSGSMLKGILSALFGIFLATIGLDPVSGSVRATFDYSELISGLPLIPILIGLFSISQAMLKLEDAIRGKASSLVQKKSRQQFNFIAWQELLKNGSNFLRSSIIGTFIGIIPATGSGTASYVAYNECKRFAKDKNPFGKGHLPGIAATESANNAVTGGALIPLLTLGIPGDIVTAVLLGGLLLQGLTPGPLLFRDNPEVINSIYISLVVSNFFMLLIGLLSIRLFIKIINIPVSMLMPAVILLCILGAYSINTSGLDVAVMVCFGFLGYAMEKLYFPLAPLLLGFILSPLIETNFRNATLASQGNLSIFFSQPISAIILSISIILIFLICYQSVKAYFFAKASRKCLT